MDLFSDDNEAERAERKDILSQLDTIVQGAQFSQSLWACLQVADLSQLRRILTEIREAYHPAVYLRGFGTSIDESQLIPHWKQLVRDASRTSSTAATPSKPGTPVQLVSRPQDVSGSPSTQTSGDRKRRRIWFQTRDRRQRDLCLQRDQRKCVITGSGEPVEVAHIFPFAMRDLQTPEQRSESSNFWNILKIFWTEEKVERWFNAIRSTTETLRNLFCLSPNAHAYQGKIYFALKHISSNENNSSRTVKFIWLPHFQNYGSLRLSTEPSVIPATTFRQDGVGGRVGLLDLPTGSAISSGHTIVWETEDPVNLPLPDVDLLELHWVLQRVAAMAGAAEPQDETYETDDEDGCGALVDDNSDVSDFLIPQKYTISAPTFTNKKAMLSDPSPIDVHNISDKRQVLLCSSDK
ncbi:conserved hypothetical protein [Histoplasma capsulatum var. duboisii H88]|uniref:HNH nuclease domain-containing protein n=3 Tax=Ajellomyces capsulatus TaxID=5037 RepID=F0UUB9_AJEC8|nr:conserved hypothetical protein [Histoplasma capsulatum H143]EGC49496.1 conserved hypothetical protein [Histoplasma capsulatum var. duboisii H88]QSS57670.1 hypothetical protein I7I53_11935 [Histoplasma capsulatum var. duboisii H88]